MDFQLEHLQSDICTKHTQPIVIVNKDGPFCVVCLQELPGNISIEQFHQQQQKLIDQVVKQIDLDHQQFQELLGQLLKFKDSIIQSLDKISQQIQDLIKSIKESKSKIESIRQSNKNQKSMNHELQLVSNKQQQFNKDAKCQLRKQLQYFQQKYTEIEQLYPFLNDKEIASQISGRMQSKIQIKGMQAENIKQFKQLQYELIKESTMKQENTCSSIAFNKDNTILVTGYEKDIVMYEFINGKISKELQRLNSSIDSCNCLYFMKQSNSFVSGSIDQSIIIWVPDKDNQWKSQQILKEHKDAVTCILMKKMEDQLIQ